MRTLTIVVTTLLLGFTPRAARAVDPYVGTDPYWVLLHEPAVHAELKLTPVQRKSLQKLTDELDLRFFPLRNKPRDVASTEAAKIVAEAKDGATAILQSSQRTRLNEILLQKSGNNGLLRDEVLDRLKYTDSQRKRIKEINDATSVSLRALNRELNSGTTRDQIERKHSALQLDQQKKLLNVLRPDQQTALKKLYGAPFDLSKLGQPAFKAPELIDTGEWINSQPLQLQELRGKVVVVHFYAFGCINCIHNYPTYKEWQDQFQGKDVVIVGIHSPETNAERDTAGVRTKAAEEKFTFPILIDGKSENWNAWGNGVWPAVYVVDKQGYLRDVWGGELKWQGAQGDKYIRERIERLLAEPSPAS